MESIAGNYGPFSSKLNSSEMLKSKMQIETVNKGLKKDGKEFTQVMGKDEFLKLLVTELQNQDPTNPMQDREFIAQMAQFSSLEQMLNVNKGIGKLVDSVSFQSSFNLLGKNVLIGDDGSENAQPITGTVESVNRKGENVYVGVNGQSYPLTSVIKVEEQ